MTEGERRAPRQDLAALQIDRSPPPRHHRPRWLGSVMLIALVLVFGTLSAVAYRLTLGRPLVVDVAYAVRSGGEGGAPEVVLTGSGYVVTRDRYISLGVRVPGRIEEYLVEEGATVRAGDPLVRLDGRRYEAALREARAAVTLARANVALRRKELVRLRELRSRDFSSQAELDVKLNQLRVAEAEVERREAELGRLELDLEDTVLRAPTAGVILEKLKEVGEIATPGGFAGSGDLIRMANLDELRAEVDVNESDLHRVRLGQPAEIVPDAYAERVYRARVVKLAPRIDRKKGTLEVELRIQDPDEWLRPDMSVRIRFLHSARAEEPGPAGVLVPAAALHEGESGRFVWLVRRGRLHRQTVRIEGGKDPGALGRVRIVEGLRGGEALALGDPAPYRENLAVELHPAGEPRSSLAPALSSFAVAVALSARPYVRGVSTCLESSSTAARMRAKASARRRRLVPRRARGSSLASSAARSRARRVTSSASVS